ncbi:MAG: Tungsten-containing aldehyde ferredoxin oxidoreductase [Promethearchaeota archaeon]|nr:MAG: Tungsten-containing aldehyde ferredoxin oxidoreductase [Candidatus Lokiarchaeota archaeon]
MKLVRINTRKNKIKTQEIEKDTPYYLLGARGLTSTLVFEEVPPKCDPLGKDNKLIISNGLLTGSPFPNSGRTSVGGKSPLTSGIKEANVGGRGAMMLAQHGIRALVLEECADTWKIIIIDEKGIHIEDGVDYVGLGNYDLHSNLYERFGKRIAIYSIGLAGEHKMKASTIAANDLQGYPSRHAARGGLGAVMGSKKIKAIIIKPSKKSQVEMNDIKKFREISKPLAKTLATSKETFSIFGTPLMVHAMSEYGGLPTESFRKGSYEHADKISGEKLHELIMERSGKNRLACSPTCVIRCSNLVKNEKGEHITSSLEYETMAMNGSNLLIDDLDVLAQIDHNCDNLGIDTIEFGCTMGVAMDAGKIQWGNEEQVFEIMEEIKKGSERGHLYGNGVCHLADEINFERIPQVKGQGMSAYDPRVFKGMGVTFATSPMGADHTAGAAIAGRSARSGKDYGDLNENKGKLELSYELQIYTTVLDSMGCCYFIGPSYETMKIVADALNAMYDVQLTRKDVINIGRDILKKEILFNTKAGISEDTNDLPRFFREESSDPVNLKVDLPSEDFKTFWERLKK